MAKGDCCTDCIIEKAHGMVCADSYRDRRTSMRELAEAALAGGCSDGMLYYVSKTWYDTIYVCMCFFYILQFVNFILISL